MGNLHGKDFHGKYRDLNTCRVQSNDYGTSWADHIERSIVVVWCDASIGLKSSSDDDSNTLMQLAQIVNRKRQLIHTFNEIHPCREFMRNVNNICLIISGAMGVELVPEIHHMSQIHSIYIFCMNKSKYQAWAKSYEKIRGVYTDIEEICDCLKGYFISSNSPDYEQLQFDILSKHITIPSEDKREFPLVYSVFSKMILSKMKSVEQSDMIDYCRMEYLSQYQQHLIHEFQMNYNQHNPIWWFTRDRFLQEVINRALQVHDLYTLAMMNPFIKALDGKLADLYRRQLPTSPKPLLLYLSQSIPIDLLRKLRLNLGSLICINQFLFANTEKIIASMFLDYQSSSPPEIHYVNILFEITIPQIEQANVYYANIGGISEFVHENEYLLSMSSIYQVDKIDEYLPLPMTWTVHLTLVDRNQAQLVKLRQMIHEQYIDRHTSDLSELGSQIVERLYQFKCTRKLFEQQFNFKSRQIRPILLHYNMGIINDCLNRYDEALEEYKHAINLTRSLLPDGLHEDRICLVPLYSNIAVTYQQLNQHKHAFDHAYRTLNILCKDGANSIYKKELSASSHFHLGLILDLQSKNQEAKTHYEQALKKRTEYLPNNHPDITSLQDIIASIHSSTPDFATF